MDRIVVLIVLCISSCVALGDTFSDDFNRPDGPVGNDWFTFGGGADVLNQELRTYGYPNLAGGVARSFELNLGQEYSFSFDFHTDAPLDGGWSIRLNSTVPEFAVGSSNLARIYQYSGNREVVYGVGTSWGEGILPDHARLVTSTGHILGVLSPDLCLTITIDYGDGGPVDQVSFPSPGIDPASVPQGPWLVFGNCNATGGPHYYDNLVVTPEPATLSILSLSGLAVMRRRHASILAAL